MNRRNWIIVAGLALLVSPVWCAAQALADRVPADALMYIGWRGAADLRPGYDQSHLKAVLDQSQLPALVHDSLPAFIQRIETTYPQAAPFLDPLTAVASPLWNHPTAFYIGPCDLSDRQNPKFRVALLCDAGTDADAMVAKLNNLIAMIPPSPVQISAKQYGTLVVVATYDFAEHPASALSADADFTAALAQVGHDPIEVVYLNGDKLTQQLNAAVQTAGNPDITSTWPKVRDALGLTGLKKLIVTDEFEGKDWGTQAFVDAPAPRQGLATFFDSHPLSDDIFKAIPDTATLAGAGQFDLAKMVEQIRSAVTQIDPGTGQQLDAGIDQVNTMLGLNVSTDLLGAFGDEWGFYLDPNVAGRGTMGIVFINHCRDAQKLGTSLSTLEKMANSTVSMFTAQATPLLTVGFRTETIDGLEVHYADLPVITPAWTIKDGIWYLGFYPQVVVAAAERPAGKSILDNPDYQDLIKRLGGSDKISGMQFLDLPKVADQGYQGLLSMTSLFVGAGDLFGMNAPPMVIPTLDKLKAEVEPTGAVTWVDDEGWHMKSLCAFPGDAILAADQNSAGLLLQCFSALGTMVARPAIHPVVAPVAPPPSPGL